ncbi:carbohydrate porin [Xanthobacter oligotrophicus]|uniref:carbohydrate porin n=1 Tax=Xanthobacter oligotrophicus TaxID=2607286 RepID=UPI0011F0C59D|nr:carbohydrate porin [Xanthobacter oligotrophicus]MCG5237345.1 carbohydrate porin [Xanthobacter oligotrophicus]
MSAPTRSWTAGRRLRSAALGAGSFFAVAAALLGGPVAMAADVATPAPAAAEAPAAEAPASIAPQLGWLGDWGGYRTKLADAGIQVGVNYIGELWRNTTGGLGTGTAYNGRFLFTLDADLDKLFQWKGATFHASALQIQGSGFSGQYLGNIMGVSGIDALSSTRLFELYIEQSFADGKATFRFGQLAADSEFGISDNASLFLNSTFGWPALFAADLPSGGPAYPLATPGVRLKLLPTDDFSIMLGLFNGNPAPCCGDPQEENHNGLNFLVDQGVFVIGEAAYSYNKGEGAAWLPGTVKVGAWYNSNAFPNQRYDVFGLSLANPETVGIAANIHGDYAAYAIIDQMIYRVPGSKDKGISVFGRIMAAPSAQNQIGFYADGGINFKGLVPYREDDAFGIAFGTTRVTSAARGLDADTAYYTGSYYPVRGSETVLEVTYSAQVTPGFTIQPDFQYIWNPGGGVLNPNDPLGLTKVSNAAVFGVRTTINY